MKAVLLAGGYGSRLRPITDKIPKCLVPIKDKPLLGIWLENLDKAGVESFLINTHYLAEQVEEFIKKSDYKSKVQLVYEKELLGTAGTIARNHKFWQDEEDLLVIHADNLCLCDFSEFIKAHYNRPKHCIMTMMTFETTKPEQSGIIELDEYGVVQKFYEKVKNPPSNLANGAVYIFNNHLLKNIGSKTDISTQIIPTLMGKIYTWKNNGLLADIGTPEIYNMYR